MNWRSIFTPLLDSFLHSRCPLCERSGNPILCQYCHRQLESCARIEPGRDWPTDPELPVFAWGDYRGTIKQAIAKLKYQGDRSIAIVLADALAEAWLQSPIRPQQKLTVIPIPLHRDKLARRGFNQSELIARRFCQLTGNRLDLSLVRIRDTEAQFNLSKADRWQNLQGAFQIGAKSSLKTGDIILLLDDIYTTGATAKSARATLHTIGIKTIGIATIAKAG
jgi:ComF family protein